ncbi:MAG: hypothetical protein HC837_05580 [Chloroflexaceae bacterium]|nr:hypothetical protein [Chloroflexaceae bacterium]
MQEQIDKRGGIFAMAFKEVGRFCEEVAAKGDEWANKVRDDLNEREKRRQMEAQTKLLEEERLAREAGVQSKTSMPAPQRRLTP